MHVYEPGALDEALKEVGITAPGVVRSKAAEIEEAAQIFLTRRQAEIGSPPHAVISRLRKISDLAGKLHAMLLEGADPDYELQESDIKRAADRSLRAAIFVASESRGSRGDEPLEKFHVEGLDGEITDRRVDRAFDHSLETVARIRDWADSAINKENNRKASRKACPPRQADYALNELIARLVEISEYGPKMSEPSVIRRRQGKTTPDGPLPRYLEFCLKPLKRTDPDVEKLTTHGLRSRVRRSAIGRIEPISKGADDEGCGEIDTAHPGYLGSQDTFYVGTLKGVGRVYQQSYVDTYAKTAHAKLYTTKTPITAADMLNDKVLPFYEQHDLPVLRILTDRGTEYCGHADRHDYELFLNINGIEHTKTKVKSSQTNGICEQFHKTILQEFYQVKFRKKIYETIEQLQNDLDEWIDHYNNERAHQGKICEGRTPMQTLEDGKAIWKEKFID